MSGAPPAAAICPDCGMFITGRFWPDDPSPTAAENLAAHQAADHASRRLTRRQVYTIALAWFVFWAALALLLWMMRGAVGGPA